MKKVLFSLAAVGLMAASANASTLSLRWAGTTSDKVAVTPSGTATIEVILEVPNNGDVVVGGFFSLQALAGNPVTHLMNAGPLPTGWIVDNSDTPNPLGGASFNAGGIVANGVGAGTHVLGTIVLQLGDDGLPAGTEYEIAFNPSGNNNLVRPDGLFYTLTANVPYSVYSGYWTYGKGSPGIQQMTSINPRDPLIITKIPEPGSLALLAIGGFAVMMRRRG